MNGIRIDKWLWAARFFKTRALAAKACELGRVRAGNMALKPAREVHVNDRLFVRTEGGDFEIDVLGLSDVRGPAAVAQTLYRETEAGRELRMQIAAQRKADMNFVPAPQGRPSKRDRRKIRSLEPEEF